MRIEELDYEYPKELIATKPAHPRDTAKLLVSQNGRIVHSDFRHLSEFISHGSVLVLNKTKVFPARIFGLVGLKKVELFFLAEIKKKQWEVLVGGRVSDGDEVVLPQNVRVKISKKEAQNIAQIPFSKKELFEYLQKNGHVPLPPYIKRKDSLSDKKEYQTVFAQKIGSAAAPTAGLHLTKRLISELKNNGVQIEYITLHVGLGTFAPVKTERVESHPIHSEYFELDKKTAEKLNKAKKENRKIIACGTTTVRTLESAFSDGSFLPQKSETTLFIYPGYKFKAVDGIITNFHTPRSSLLALVYAFSGQKNIRRIYNEAIEKKYRLFSYGDGMLLL